MSNYVAVAGNMGAGKSTLVELLASLHGMQPFFESNNENPYLPDFYLDMKKWAFHSQLFFIIHKFKIHQQAEKSSGFVLLDRTIYEDAEIFARALFNQGKINGTDFQTYQQLYQTILQTLRPPDLLIFLKCSLNHLQKRIALRGRNIETNIPLDYLQELQLLYDQWIANYKASKILIIQTDELDYVHNPFHRLQVISQIEAALNAPKSKPSLQQEPLHN